MVKRATSLLSPFCSSVAKQVVARICCPFYPYLYPKNVYYRVLSYDWYGPARNVVGNPYASIDRAGKTRTALLEKRTVWCGFAPSEKHNGHDKKLIDRVRSGQTCARSVRPDLEPNSFPYGPTTESVST